LEELYYAETKIKHLLILAETKNSQTPRYLNTAAPAPAAYAPAIGRITPRSMKRADVPI